MRHFQTIHSNKSIYNGQDSKFLCVCPHTDCKLEISLLQYSVVMLSSPKESKKCLYDSKVYFFTTVTVYFSEENGSFYDTK